MPALPHVSRRERLCVSTQRKSLHVVPEHRAASVLQPGDLHHQLVRLDLLDRDAVLMQIM